MRLTELKEPQTAFTTYVPRNLVTKNQMHKSHYDSPVSTTRYCIQIPFLLNRCECDVGVIHWWPLRLCGSQIASGLHFPLIIQMWHEQYATMFQRKKANEKLPNPEEAHEGRMSVLEEDYGEKHEQTQPIALPSRPHALFCIQSVGVIAEMKT